MVSPPLLGVKVSVGSPDRATLLNVSDGLPVAATWLKVNCPPF